MRKYSKTMTNFLNDVNSRNIQEEDACNEENFLPSMIYPMAITYQEGSTL
jgi:hypothetical protein